MSKYCIKRDMIEKHGKSLNLLTEHALLPLVHFKILSLALNTLISSFWPLSEARIMLLWLTQVLNQLTFPSTDGPSDFGERPEVAQRWDSVSKKSDDRV